MAESEAELQVAQGSNQFASNLYQILSKSGGNLLFSPLSLHTVLSISYQGAQGTTADHLACALHVPNAEIAREGYNTIIKNVNKGEKISWHLANKLYLKEDYELLDEFNDVITSNFLSEVECINFKDTERAARTINEWVENQTQNEIRDLIDKKKLNNLTTLVLINAVYFKGWWKQPFYTDQTEIQPFFINDEETVNVEMMYLFEELPYKHDYDLGAYIVQLHYINENYSMIIILPDQRNGINELEQTLANYDLSKITQDLSAGDNVMVALPKFKIEESLDLKDALSKLGLEEIFDKYKANFKGMLHLDTCENLYVSEVVQKAFIEVDEVGTTGAVATAQSKEVFMCARPEVIANHPFIFLLKMKESIVFMGKIVKP